MQTSSSGINLIKSFESLALDSYVCPAGKLTIGYGHTGSDVREGMHVTAEQAEATLRQDLVRFENAVNTAVTAPLRQSQFDALVCFTFNVGAGNFGSSTLLKLLNQRDYAGAANEFLRWDHGGGKVLPGLTRRREAERALFLQPTETAVSA
jgi:lysozyme